MNQLVIDSRQGVSMDPLGLSFHESFFLDNSFVELRYDGWALT